MRDRRPKLDDVARSSGVALRLGVAYIGLGAAGCTRDAPISTQPLTSQAGLHVDANLQEANAIVVSTSIELVAALIPENAGRRIRVRAGDYSLTQPLGVPDDVALEGEGVMLLDGAGLPTGFAAGTRTTLTMTANTPGNILTLGNGVTVRGLAIQDMPGRSGNAIGIVSRAIGDRVSATVTEIEILNPTIHGVAPQGPTGCGIAVLTLNPSLGSDPPPHAGAAITARITRSLIRSPAMGIGCGLFAFNFAPDATVSITLADNVIGGGIDAGGGVSRPDFVHDSRTEIESRHNLYRDDTGDPCGARRVGLKMQGGSGPPIPLPTRGTVRNVLRLRSDGDRIEDFTVGVSGTAAWRFFPEPTSGAISDNQLDMELLGTRISTPSCGGAPFVADIRLSGASVTDASLVPGDGNTLRAVVHGVTGSGTRSNVYADVLGPTGPVTPQAPGSRNRLAFIGNLQSFIHSNRAIDPVPGAQFFNGGK